jgi:hypothetical protein
LNKTTLAKIIGVVAFLTLPFVAYELGQRSAKGVTWLSELLTRTQGSAGYLINVNVQCANGKVLGPLQVDLNLTNGKLRVVRDDAGRFPDCTLPPTLPPPQPPPNIQAPLTPEKPAVPAKPPAK